MAQTMNVGGRFRYATLPGIAEFYRWEVVQSIGAGLKVIRMKGILKKDIRACIKPAAGSLSPCFLCNILLVKHKRWTGATAFIE